MRWRHWPYIVPLRARSIFRHTRVEAELDEELQFHLEQKMEDGLRRGLTLDEARIDAVRAIDGMEQRKEEMRDMRHIHWLSDFMQDLRYAMRSIGKARGFTALVVVILALGIGINSAIFSLADALVLRPLPVLRPSEVVTIGSTSPNDSFGSFSYPDYADVRAQAKSLEGVAAFTRMTSFGFSSQPEELPRLIGGMINSGNLFTVMGVKPELGRDFRPDEDRVPGRDAVLILGHDFWETHFGADRSIIGRSVKLNGLDFTVIGVAPKSFTGLDQFFRPAVFVPTMMWSQLVGGQENPLNDRNARELIVKARVRRGSSLEQAQSEFSVIARNLAKAYPKTNAKLGFSVRTELQARYEHETFDVQLVAMLILLALAVLLVACANVASLLLSRAHMRSREIAIRLAIGAGRFRLVRLLLTESLVIALLGGVLGLVFGYGGVRFLGSYKLPIDLPMALHVQVDGRVLLFSLAVSLLSAIAFGLAPALRTTRTDLVTAMKTADVEVPGHKRLWGRDALVIAQVAGSLALLIVSAEMLRGFQQRFDAGVGFRSGHALTMGFDPRLVHLGESQTKEFYRQLVKRAQTAPGVRSAALVAELPMYPDYLGINLVPEGYQLPKGKEAVSVQMNVIDGDYFDTFGVAMSRGRVFRDTDTADSPRVAIVNEQFAKLYFPNRDALGKRFRMDSAGGPLVQIVGISKTAKYNWIDEPPTDYVYLPLSQHPRSEMTLLAATSGDSASLAAPLRNVVRGLDPKQPVFNVRTMEDYYRMRVMGAPRLVEEMVSAMGLTGLVLAIAGLYGSISYAVSRRTREIGIRMAIGASRLAVVRMIMRQGVVLVAIGIVIGIGLGWLAEQGSNAVFGATGVDVVAYLLVIPAMLAVTMIAAFIPARRASRVEPMRALRYE